MGKVIVIGNNKGGVGKTTTSVNVAVGLAEKGFKTLLIDLDQQANATDYLGCSGEGVKNIADIFFDFAPVMDVAMKTPYKNLWLVPSGTAFINGEQKILGSNRTHEMRLKSSLRDNDFDYIIIDCPPSLSTLITNAFIVATHIIIPCATDGFSLEGLKIIIEKIATDQQDFDINTLEGYAVLWTRIDKRHNIVRNLLAEGDKQELPSFETAIRSSIRVNESTVDKKPLVLYDPNCNPAVDYRNLVLEIMNWTNQ